MKDEGNKTWEETENVSKFTGSSMACQLKYLIGSATASFLKLQTPNEVVGFLEKSVYIDGLEDVCAKAGLTWDNKN